MCQSVIANYYFENKPNEPTGISYSLEAIKNYKNTNQPSNYHYIADLYINLTRADFLSNDVSAIQSYSDSAIYYTNKIIDKKFKLVSLINILRNLNEEYIHNPNVELLKQCKAYLNEINILSKSVDDYILTIICLRMNETQSVFEKKYHNALKFNLNALKMSISMSDTASMLYDYYRIGITYKSINNLIQARRWFDMGLVMTNKYKHDRYQLIFLHELALIYFNSGMFLGALQYAKKSLMISEATKSDVDMMKNYLLLSKIDSVNGNKTSEIINFKKYFHIKDSLNSNLANKKVITLAQYFEIAKMKNATRILKNENVLKDEEIKKDTSKILYLSIIAVVCLVMALIFFLFYRKFKNQSNLLTVQKNLISKQIIELESQNNKLEQINQEKNDLIGVVSHDLKAPLNRAQALIDLIVQDSISGLNYMQISLFDRLKNEIVEGKYFISEILNAELLETELNTCKNENLDLNEVIVEMIQKFLPIAASKDIKLTYSLYAENLCIHANLNYLKRALDNLISNAIKFSNSGKTVLVLVDKVDDDIFLHIIDQGLGFSADDQNNLFKKYKKLSSKPTAGEASTGLGLSIVKSLIEAMNGSISLISEKNVGSTFSLKFKAV